MYIAEAYAPILYDYLEQPFNDENKTEQNVREMYKQDGAEEAINTLHLQKYERKLSVGRKLMFTDGSYIIYVSPYKFSGAVTAYDMNDKVIWFRGLTYRGSWH